LFLRPTFILDAGAAYGTAAAGEGIMWSGIDAPDLIWRNLIPIVMAGVNGIYGLITSIIIVSSIRGPEISGYYSYSMYTGCAHLAAGLCCGLSGLGSGMCIGIAGNASVHACSSYESESKSRRGGVGGGRGNSKKSGGGDKLFIGMVLIQVFAGNVALYGLIASILVSQQNYYCGA